MAKDLRQSHAVEAPSGSEQSFHSQVKDCSPMSSTNAPAERDVSDKTPNGGKPFSGPGLRRDLSSAASHVRSSGEMRGARSKKSIKLFGVEISPSAGQGEETSTSERPYRRDGDFVGPSLCRDLSSAACHVSSSGDVRGEPRSKKSIKSFAVQLSPSAGQREETSMSERPYQRDGTFVDQRVGYNIKVNEHLMITYLNRHLLKSDLAPPLPSQSSQPSGQASLSNVEMGSGYDCRYCSKKFSSKHGLGIHQGLLHRKERQQAESAEIQARRSAVNQNTARSLLCYPMQEVQEVQLPSDYFSSHQQGEQPQSQGPFAADDSSLDLELRPGPPEGVPPLRSKSSQPSGKSRVPPVETRSRSKKSIKLFGVEIFPSAGQREEASMSKRPHQRDGAFVDQSDRYTIEVKNGSQVKDDEMGADVKSDPRGMAGGDDVRSDLKEEQGKGGSISSDSKRSYDCQYCSKKFPETRNLLALSQAQEHQQQSQGRPHAVDDTSLDLELRLGSPGSVPPLRSKSSQPSGKPRVPPVETRSDYFSSHQQEQQQSQGPFAADDSSLDLELRLGPPGSVPPLHFQRSGKPDDSSLDLELRLGPPGSVPPLHSQRSGKPSGESTGFTSRNATRLCLFLS